MKTKVLALCAFFGMTAFMSSCTKEEIVFTLTRPIYTTRLVPSN